MLISSTASSAERPRHGAPALCAVSPSNVYSIETRPVPPCWPQPTSEVAADVREQVDVDVLEHAVAHEPGLRRHELFGDAGPQHDRAGQLVALHDPLHGDRRDDVERHAGVVAFAVTRRALDDRIVIRDARLLRRLRNAVDVGAERDHRLARSVGRHPRRRNARLPARHLEAELLELRGQVPRRLDFLHAELAEAEDGVDHLLRELRHLVDALDGFFLLAVELRASSCAAESAPLYNGTAPKDNAASTIPTATARFI